MNKAKVLMGKVVSAKTPNTVIVAVDHVTRHPLYKKAIRRTRRFAAHVEAMELVVGDTIEMKESKPISRTKRFIVVKKVN
jgi:small subunit ribosomal protein S17